MFNELAGSRFSNKICELIKIIGDNGANIHEQGTSVSKKRSLIRMKKKPEIAWAQRIKYIYTYYVFIYLNIAQRN